MRRSSILLALLVTLLAPVTIAAPAGAEPPPEPDLSGYTAVSADPFVSAGDVYFQSPNGLCAILLGRGVAGCEGGQLPGTLPGVNQIVLAADTHLRGLRSTAAEHGIGAGDYSFVKTSGGAAPVLRDGEKIAFGDFECAVGPGPRTACTKGEPVTQWMVISPSRTGIGPATEGLPDGFPDPNDYVLGDDTYLVGSGPKNLFPVFTVDGGLTCTIRVFSGGEIGCDGPLPGVTGGQNEVFTQLPGVAAVRRTDQPKFTTPAFPGTVRRLPVGHRVHGENSTCMAITGGVACFGSLAGTVTGFTVSPSGTTTYGGS